MAYKKACSYNGWNIKSNTPPVAYKGTPRGSVFSLIEWLLGEPWHSETSRPENAPPKGHPGRGTRRARTRAPVFFLGGGGGGGGTVLVGFGGSGVGSWTAGYLTHLRHYEQPYGYSQKTYACAQFSQAVVGLKCVLYGLMFAQQCF